VIALDSDAKILDEIEAVINQFMQEFYHNPIDPNGDRMPVAATFYMGQVAGLMMKRGNP
jgi:hypothetical protein